jgi:hypothetical protein
MMSLVREAKSETLFKKMNLGVVYRRSDLTRWSRAVDRNLDQLVSEHKVLRLSPGLYMRPNTSPFGALPADDKSLVESFLKDKRFLLNSYNNYTQLGLGLTQLYNTQVVYNYKRHGEFELGGKKFFFKRAPKFPRQLSKEYLLIDLLNNLKHVAEDQNLVLESFLKRKSEFDSKKVLSVAKEYARPFVKKFLEQAYKV